jgi:lysophospholipase L1-like esterase
VGSETSTGAAGGFWSMLSSPTAMDRHRRSYLPEIALLLASVAVVFGLGEIAVRALGVAPAWGPMVWVANTTGKVKPRTVALLAYPSNPGGYFPLDLSKPEVRRYYEDLGVRHIDDAVASGSPFAIEYRYNALGFRGPDPPPRQPGVVRVAFLGDSFTLGWGVREEHAYPRRVEAALAGDPPATVINCGRAGADFPLMTSVFERCLAADPDVVVYAMVLNDPDRSAQMLKRLREGALRSANNLVVPYRAPGSRQAPLRSRMLAFVLSRYDARQTTAEMVSWHLDLVSEPNKHAWQRTKAAIREMDARMKARGGRFLLVLWPLLAELDGEYPLAAAHEAVAVFAERAQIPFLDLLPALRGRRTAALWVHPIDRHPNAQAHQLVAERLVQWLRPHIVELARPRGDVPRPGS